MATPASLLARIRGEFREMPGLRLTVSQACRLWQLEAHVCEQAIAELVQEGFLHRTSDGKYLTLRAVELRPAKAALPATDHPRTYARHRAS